MLTSANDYVRVILFFLYFFEIVKTRVYIYRSPGTYRESENRQILSNRSAIYRKFLLHPPSSFKAYPSSHVGFEITTLPETLQFLAASKLSNYLRCFSFRYRFGREGIITAKIQINLLLFRNALQLSILSISVLPFPSRLSSSITGREDFPRAIVSNPTPNGYGSSISIEASFCSELSPDTRFKPLNPATPACFLLVGTHAHEIHAGARRAHSTSGVVFPVHGYPEVRMMLPTRGSLFSFRNSRLSTRNGTSPRFLLLFFSGFPPPPPPPFLFFSLLVETVTGKRWP